MCRANDPENAASFLDTGGTKGIRDVSGRGQADLSCALTIAAEGGKADIVKPLHGLGSGVFEIALPFKSDAFRVVYALRLAEEIWVVHAFQKKSTQGVRHQNVKSTSLMTG